MAHQSIIRSIVNSTGEQTLLAVAMRTPAAAPFKRIMGALAAGYVRLQKEAA